MFRKHVLGMAFTLVAVMVLALSAAAQNTTQPGQAKSADVPMKRLVYNVKHGVARELAPVLNKHFHGDAEFEPAPESAGNILLISAKPAVHDEVLATLGKLDRKPRLVTIEFMLLDVTPNKNADGKTEPGTIDEKALSGPAERVLANIKALEKKGVLATYGQLQMSTVEGKTTTLREGGSKPYIGGAVVTGDKAGKARTTNTLLYRDSGTDLVVTPWVSADSVVMLDVNLKGSRPMLSEIALTKDENGQSVFATEFPTVSYNSKVSINSGEAILAEGVQTTAKQPGVKTLIVITAKVVHP